MPFTSILTLPCITETIEGLCDPTLLHVLIFGNKKQTSQKYYRTLTFLIMLGHMQKVSHF